MQTKEIKVLFLASWYPSRLQPMLGNFVQRQAEAICRFAPIQVVYAETDPNLKRLPFEIVSEVRKDVENSTVYYKKSIWLPGILNRFFAYDTLFRKYKHEKRIPDVVHVNIAFPAGLYAVWLKHRYGIPFIISEHWSAYLPGNERKLSSLKRYLSKVIFRESDFIITVTKNLGNAIQKEFYPTAPIRVIPNTVDTNVFFPKAEKSDFKKDKKRILHVSTLDEDAKNIFGILRTIKKVSQQRMDFELHIIHEYASESHVNYAKELGLLETVVFFHGQKNTVEVADSMRDSDFFVLFSNYESLPVVLLESLACGRPVIATCVGGIPEYIHEEQGILINPNDETALLRSIDFMLDHSKDYDPFKLADYARINFSMDAVGKSISEIYNAVVLH